MVNTNRETGFDQVSVHLRLELPRGGQIQLWDAVSTNKYKLAGELTYKTAAFKIDIPPSGSRLVVVTGEPQDLPPYQTCQPTENVVTLDPAGWNFLLDDHNVLVLDRADCKADPGSGKKFARSHIEILQLDHELSNLLDLPLRGGRMLQPWAQEGQPIGPAMPITLTYKFNVKAIPASPVMLALEQPERWRITLNGKPVSSDMAVGWWVDPSIKTLPVEPTIFKRGRNTIVLEGQFDRHTDLEIMYLLGQFGVTTDGKNSAIARMPGKLSLGSWRGQALPFYSGNVVYRTQFELKVNPDRRYMLDLPKFHAIAVEIAVNDHDSIVLGWPDYRVDITEYVQNGKNAIDIKLLGSRRNAFGPLHMTDDKPRGVGPETYRLGPDEWQDEYKLVDYGLFEPPVVTECSTQS